MIASARRSILRGAKGLISVTAMSRRAATSDMVAAAMKGTLVAAERLDERLRHYIATCFWKRIQSRQVGIDAHGNDRERHTTAAHRAVR